MLSRPLGITILGTFHILAGAAPLAAIAFGSMMYMHQGAGAYLLGFGGTLISVGLLSAVDFIIAGALFSARRRGRIVVIAFTIISLVANTLSISDNSHSIPVLILDAVVLWYMWRPHVVAYFGGRSTSVTNPSKTPLDILKEKYARGEITKEEFEEKKKDLQ